jgi:hypothetical protein
MKREERDYHGSPSMYWNKVGVEAQAEARAQAEAADARAQAEAADARAQAEVETAAAEKDAAEKASKVRRQSHHRCSRRILRYGRTPAWTRYLPPGNARGQRAGGVNLGLEQ